MAFIDVLLPFEVLQIMDVVAGQSEYSCRLGFVNAVELSVAVILLAEATNEYQASGLLPVPWPQGFEIAVYVAPVNVPDVLEQLDPCVKLMAFEQRSFAGCANKIVGKQINIKAIDKTQIGDLDLIVWILAYSRIGQ